MDVIAHALEIAVARAIDDQRLLAPGEQVAEGFVPPARAAEGRPGAATVGRFWAGKPAAVVAFRRAKPGSRAVLAQKGRKSFALRLKRYEIVGK